MQAFNRTAYGIEIAAIYVLWTGCMTLLIAPLMELKFSNNLSRQAFVLF